ncbi:hypothetical protein OH77DRAFT_921833 [Trametes cingulata]|nr:hypothetical protein OH77DRAFT_921833 [Trametes cingulata]
MIRPHLQTVATCLISPRSMACGGKGRAVRRGGNTAAGGDGRGKGCCRDDACEFSEAVTVDDGRTAEPGPVHLVHMYGHHLSDDLQAQGHDHSRRTHVCQNKKPRGEGRSPTLGHPGVPSDSHLWAHMDPPTSRSPSQPEPRSASLAHALLYYSRPP